MINTGHQHHCKTFSSISCSYSTDPRTVEDIKEWERAFRGDPLQLGKSQVLLDGNEGSCRLMECSIGNLVTDAMVMGSMTPATDDKWTEAPIALVNAGSIRASMPVGRC